MFVKLVLHLGDARDGAGEIAVAGEHEESGICAWSADTRVCWWSRQRHNWRRHNCSRLFVLGLCLLVFGEFLHGSGDSGDNAAVVM